MKRQGLQTTIKELREIADELEEEIKEEKFFILDENTMFQINIINKKGLSDTWRFG